MWHKKEWLLFSWITSHESLPHVQKPPHPPPGAEKTRKFFKRWPVVIGFVAIRQMLQQKFEEKRALLTAATYLRSFVTPFFYHLIIRSLLLQPTAKQLAIGRTVFWFSNCVATESISNESKCAIACIVSLYKSFPKSLFYPLKWKQCMDKPEKNHINKTKDMHIKRYISRIGGNTLYRCSECSKKINDLLPSLMSVCFIHILVFVLNKIRYQHTCMCCA